MKYILDTHILFWSLYDSNKISDEVKEIIENDGNDIYISTASIWEIAIKHNKNPKAMPISGEEFYHDCLSNNYYILPILAKTIPYLDKIKLKDGSFVNNDPFDRLLIAQAKHQNYMLLSHDKCMKYYDETCIIAV